MNPEMVLAAKISILAMRTQTFATHFTLAQETTLNFDVFHPSLEFQPRLNFINVLRTAFMLASVKRYV